MFVTMVMAHSYYYFFTQNNPPSNIKKKDFNYIQGKRKKNFFVVNHLKELLCISDEKGSEASVSKKTQNRFGQVATDSELNRRKVERIPGNTGI